MWKESKWIAGAFLLFTLTAFAVSGYIRDLQGRNLALKAQAQALSIENAGLKAIKPSTPGEVVKLVEVPKEVVRLVHDKVLVPVASAKVEGAPQVVRLDCPSLSTGQPGEADKTQLDVPVALTGQLFIGANSADWTPFWRGTLRVKVGPKEVEWTEANAKVEAVFNEDIRAALQERASDKRVALGMRPWRKWRLGWVAGAGLAVDPFNSRVSPGVFVGYGVQF